MLSQHREGEGFKIMKSVRVCQCQVLKKQRNKQYNIAMTLSVVMFAVYDVIHMQPVTTHIYNNTKAALAFPNSVYLTRMQLLALFNFNSSLLTHR